MSCLSCGLPNYDGTCPYCQADWDKYQEKLAWAFDDLVDKDVDTRDDQSDDKFDHYER